MLAKDVGDFPSSLRGKRILLATESLGPINGVSKTTGTLIEYLRSHNVDVAVVAPRLGAHKQQTGQSDAADLRLSGWPLPYNPDLTIVYPFRLNRMFEQTLQPDLIYLASPASVGFQILLQVRQCYNSPPVLCNFQTDLSSYSEIIFPKYMGRYAVWLLKCVQGYLFNASAVKTIFFPCSDVQRYLLSSGVQSHKLVRLGRGVDTSLFNPSRRDDVYRHELAPKGEIILICVSRLAPEKGFEFLARVALKLAAEGTPFRLLIVGGNRNPTVESEVQRCFEPVRDKVVFTGFLSGSSLARAYASADLFLHCSITETFGLVVLESMASGVPVVARDLGGPSEIIQDQKTGNLVPPDDLDLFVQRVTLLCKSRDLRSAYAESARQVALDTTWQKINSRAAWHMAEAVERHTVSCHPCWPVFVGHIPFVGDIFERLVRRIRRFHEHVLQLLAIALVTLFWVIACIPLIVHGTITFKNA